MSTEKSMNKMKQFEQNFDKQKWLSDIAETYLDVSQGLYSIQNEEFDIIYTSQPLLELLGYKNENDLPSSAGESLLDLAGSVSGLRLLA